jgi:cation-transporting ATPase 13A1
MSSSILSISSRSSQCLQRADLFRLKMTAAKIVSSKSIKATSLHRSLSRWRHLYVWPFVFVAYPLVIYTLYFHQPAVPRKEGSAESVVADDQNNGVEFRFVLWMASITLNVLTFLACHWSNRLCVLFMYSKASSVAQATHICLVPTEHHGKGAICALETVSVFNQFLCS